MVTKAITATTIGINAHLIEVEVDVVNSLPNISIVGLPDSAVHWFLRRREFLSAGSDWPGHGWFRRFAYPG